MPPRTIIAAGALALTTAFAAQVHAYAQDRAPARPVADGPAVLGGALAVEALDRARAQGTPMALGGGRMPHTPAVILWDEIRLGRRNLSSDVVVRIKSGR
ncbi:MAG TPA: hypothetical protein VF342_05100 [Alphaproteobacteria bacterium]